MPSRAVPEKAFRNIGVLNDRDHRKIVVIDGREAFVGGHCIVDSWLGDAEHHEQFADVSVHLARADRAQPAGRIQRELGRRNR